MLESICEGSSSSEEDFSIEIKVKQDVKRKRKNPENEEEDNIIIKYLIINIEEYFPEHHPKRVEYSKKQFI